MSVELLAPAGDPECFMAAVLAGADAIYVGGSSFGARAYAKNFSEEELLHAIRMAHLYEKKVYMTVNTLVKEAELKKLPAFLQPYYEEGLDGVIMQDLGAVRMIRRFFPDLEIHASTQMTITGFGAANYLKKYGVTRIVPARELSLAELKAVRRSVQTALSAAGGRTFDQCKGRTISAQPEGSLYTANSSKADRSRNRLL